MTGKAFAFADVVKALAEVRTATWKTATEVTLPDGQVVKSTAVGMFLAPSRERIETTTNGVLSIQITDGTKDKVLGLSPSTKTAVVIDVKNAPGDKGSPFGKTNPGLRDLITLADSGRMENAKPLGRKTIAGISAEGYRIQLGDDGSANYGPTPRPCSPCVSNTNRRRPSVQIVMTDFQVNVELDEAEFSLDLPAGYTRPANRRG